jgi:hypothetical protein
VAAVVAGVAVAMVRGAFGVGWGRWLNLTAACTPRRHRSAWAMPLPLLTVLEVRQQFRAELLA